MAGKIMIALLGGDVRGNVLPSGLPKEAGRIIRACLEPAITQRPKDGMEVMQDFTRAIKSAWGRKYRPLYLPVRD
jgi:hypothetical protein